MKPGKAGTVLTSDLTTHRMAGGMENMIKTVIHDGVVKDWVGIGWITLDEAPDPDKHPVAISEPA